MKQYDIVNATSYDAVVAVNEHSWQHRTRLHVSLGEMEGPEDVAGARRYIRKLGVRAEVIA